MLERVQSILSLGVRHLSAYGDLVAEDLSVASAALGLRLLVSAVLAVAVLLFLEIACFWMVAAAWNTPHREWVIGWLAAFFLAIACGAALSLRLLKRRRPGVLALSAQEWEKDRQLLAELLGTAGSGPREDRR
jgi:hypothetical protein